LAGHLADIVDNGIKDFAMRDIIIDENDTDLYTCWNFQTQRQLTISSANFFGGNGFFTIPETLSAMSLLRSASSVIPVKNIKEYF